MKEISNQLIRKWLYTVSTREALYIVAVLCWWFPALPVEIVEEIKPLCYVLQAACEYVLSLPDSELPHPAPADGILELKVTRQTRAVSVNMFFDGFGLFGHSRDKVLVVEWLRACLVKWNDSEIIFTICVSSLLWVNNLPHPAGARPILSEVYVAKSRCNPP